MLGKYLFRLKRKLYKNKTDRFVKNYYSSKQYLNEEFLIPFKTYGIGNNERIIEIPWALSKASKYTSKNGGKILEIGYVRAWHYWIQLLKTLQKVSEVHLTDIKSINETKASKELFDGFKIHQDDITNSRIKDRFDVIFLISTMEHFGKKDHLIRLPYGSSPLYTDIRGFEDHKKDIEGLKKISELLAENGVILCSVPFGKLADYGSHIIYDRDRIELLKKECLLEEVESSFYFFKDGWKEVSEERLNETLYQQNFAEAATGLGCFVFRKKV